MALSNEQRHQRQIDAQRGLGGRGWREVQEGDADYDQAVLSQELEGGHFDPLDSDTFYSQGSGDTWRFKNKQGKSVNATPEMLARARADQATWSDAYNAGQGGGDTGAGGTDRGASFGGGDLASRVKKVLEDRLAGSDQFFGEKATRQAKAGQFETIQRRLRADQRQAGEDAVDSGQGEGAAYDTTLNSNRRGASEEYATGARETDQDMRMGAFQAQSDALKDFLEQTRAEAEQAIAREGNAIQRERIAADQRIAERQISAHMSEIQKQMDGERASGAANREWQDRNAERNRQWDNEDWLRNHQTSVPPG